MPLKPAKKQRKPSSYFQHRTKENTTTVSNQSTKEQSLSTKLIQNLRDINLRDFIHCYKSKDLEKLIIDGTPTEEELQDAWDKLRMDYIDLTGGVKQKTYFGLLKLLISLRARKEQFLICQRVLKAVYSDMWAKELDELCETELELNPENWEQYLQDIDDNCNEFLAPLSMEIRLKQIEFDQISEEDEDSKEMQEDDFYDALLDISDHIHTPLTDLISMWEYCRRIARLKEHIKELNSKQDAS